MAERIRRGHKYNKIVEIGDAARRNLDRLQKERIVKFLPDQMHEDMFYPKNPSEAAHFCVVCGKHGEYRMSEHLQRAHKDVLPKNSIEYKIVDQLGRGITQFIGKARINLSIVRRPITDGEWEIYNDLKQQIKMCGIPIEGGHQDRRIDRYRYLRRDEADIERQELQEGLEKVQSEVAQLRSRYEGKLSVQDTRQDSDSAEELVSVDVKEHKPSRGSKPAHSKVKFVPSEALEPSTSRQTSTITTPQRQLLYLYFGDKEFRGGDQVAEVFKATPNFELMFSHEKDLPGYYLEHYHVSKKHEKDWQRKVAEFKYYRKLDRQRHPLLIQFEEFIHEMLPGAPSVKDKLKNGIWNYLSYIERFMLIAMRARDRVNETVTVDDAIYSCEIVDAFMQRLQEVGVSVQTRKGIIKALVSFNKFIDLKIEPKAGRERRTVLKRGRRRFLHYIARLNVEEKQKLSMKGIEPSEEQGEHYCVARVVVEHKGIEETVEELMNLFEQKGTLQPAQYNYLMGALWCYIIHCNTSRNECIYKMMYGSIVPCGKSTGLTEHKINWSETETELLWIGRYPIPKSRAKALRGKTPYHGQYFVLDKKSKKWIEYYMKLRDFVIEKERLQGMNEPIAPFFLQYKGRRVHQVTVPHIIKQFLRDSGFGELNLSCNTTRHAIAGRQYEEYYDQLFEKMSALANPHCAFIAGHTVEMQLLNYQDRYQASCAYGYVKVRQLAEGEKVEKEKADKVREVQKMFKVPNLERRRNLADLEEEFMEMDDYDEGLRSQAGLENIGTDRGAAMDVGAELEVVESEEDVDFASDEGEDVEESDEDKEGEQKLETFSRSDPKRRQLGRSSKVKASPVKRARVSSPLKEDSSGSSSLEDIVMEEGDTAPFPSRLKQFDRTPRDSDDEGPIKHIVIDEEEELEIEKMEITEMTAHLSKGDTNDERAEHVNSEVTTVKVEKAVRAVQKSFYPSSLLDILAERFEGDVPSLQSQYLNDIPYIDGLAPLNTMYERNSFLRRCHAQGVQDFPWLQVREMPTINGRGVFAKANIAKGMAVADYRGYRGKKEEVLKPYLDELDDHQRHRVASYWMGLANADCKYIVLAHCESYKATVTLGRLINQSIEHANLELRCIHFGEHRVRWLHCFIAKRDIKAGEQLLWNYGARERRQDKDSFPDNYPCICNECDPDALHMSTSTLMPRTRPAPIPRVWDYGRSLSEEDLRTHERPPFDVGELLFMVTQKANVVGLLPERAPIKDPRVAFARSRRVVFGGKKVFPDPGMDLVKAASPLSQLLRIATKAAFTHMESVVVILYRERNDPQPMVILLGARHLEDSGHRYGCCVVVIGEDIYAVERQAMARAEETPLHLELLEAGPLTRHFPQETIEPWDSIRCKPKLSHQQILQLLLNETERLV